MTKPRKFIPHPETWDEVAIEEPEEKPQLDLFEDLATNLWTKHNHERGRTMADSGQVVHGRASALVSPCGRYRYRLSRDYRDTMENRSDKTLLWIMLNPSTADARVDDPTIRKCRGFSERLGFGRFSVGNLFAYRATKPEDLLAVANRCFVDAVGPDNDAHLADMIAEADAVMFAWGSHGRRFVDRCEQVKRMVPNAKAGRLGALSKESQPRHPLMLSYNTEVVWRDRDPR